MPITATNGIVTQITTVKLPPDNQEEVLALMTERAQFSGGVEQHNRAHDLAASPSS